MYGFNALLKNRSAIESKLPAVMPPTALSKLMSVEVSEIFQSGQHHRTDDSQLG